MQIPMTIRVGVQTQYAENPLGELLSQYGDTAYIADDGKPGRVLDSLCEEMVSGDTRVYVVGPGKMMEFAAKRLLCLGMTPNRVQLSMEKLTLCGVGMCGECYCAGKLPCKEGTFYTYEELLQEEETL